MELEPDARPVADDSHAAFGDKPPDGLDLLKVVILARELMEDAGQEHHVIPARELLEVFLCVEGGSRVSHGGFDGGADVVALVHAASGFDALTDTVFVGRPAPVVEDARSGRDVWF